MNFNLMRIHGFRLEELENMLPYERDVYVMLLTQWIEQENKRIRDAQQ